jgi:hypothetical protein
MAAVPTTNHKGVPLMFMAPIAALNVRAATEELALSARPDAPVRPASSARRRRWRRWPDDLRLALAARRALGRPAPAVR